MKRRQFSSGFDRGITVDEQDIAPEWVFRKMMNRGRLSGNIGGIGSFDYKGNVSVNELKVNDSLNNIVYQHPINP